MLKTKKFNLIMVTFDRCSNVKIGREHRQITRHAIMVRSGEFNSCICICRWNYDYYNNNNNFELTVENIVNVSDVYSVCGPRTRGLSHFDLLKTCFCHMFSCYWPSFYFTCTLSSFQLLSLLNTIMNPCRSACSRLAWLHLLHHPHLGSNMRGLFFGS